jgi:hypothetical protein
MRGMHPSDAERAGVLSKGIFLVRDLVLLVYFFGRTPLVSQAEQIHQKRANISESYRASSPATGWLPLGWR